MVKKQVVIDFYHPDNKPIADYIKKCIKIQKTLWNDAILPENTSAVVDYLLHRELSKKIVQQGQAARAISVTGKSNSKDQHVK